MSNGVISKTRQRNITKAEAISLRGRMDTVRKSASTLIPNTHFGYWGGIFLGLIVTVIEPLVGFAGYVTQAQAEAIVADADKRYTFYDNIVKGYNIGNLAYIITETAQFISTPTGEQGWIPVGFPQLIQYQTATGEWVTIG